MIKLEDVKHAQTWRLRYLNDKLSGLDEYQKLKIAIKQELNLRKKKNTGLQLSWLERYTHNVGVLGSSPSGPKSKKKKRDL